MIVRFSRNLQIGLGTNAVAASSALLALLTIERVQVAVTGSSYLRFLIGIFLEPDIRSVSALNALPTWSILTRTMVSV